MTIVPKLKLLLSTSLLSITYRELELRLAIRSILRLLKLVLDLVLIDSSLLSIIGSRIV
jgi:hypothetical protein